MSYAITPGRSRNSEQRSSISGTSSSRFARLSGSSSRGSSRVSIGRRSDSIGWSGSRLNNARSGAAAPGSVSCSRRTQSVFPATGPSSYGGSSVVRCSMRCWRLISSSGRACGRIHQSGSGAWSRCRVSSIERMASGRRREHWCCNRRSGGWFLWSLVKGRPRGRWGGRTAWMSSLSRMVAVRIGNRRRPAGLHERAWGASSGNAWFCRLVDRLPVPVVSAQELRGDGGVDSAPLTFATASTTP
jgi:hypothetical protein